MSFKVYISNDCSNCHTLISKMQEKQLSYEILNISTDRKAAKHLVKELKVKTVPLVECEKGFVLGNDPNLNMFLGIA